MIATIQQLLNNRLTVRLFEKATGTKVFSKLPLGIYPFTDIQYRVPDFAMHTIVDVGANIGQSAIKFRKHFPAATIHSIEPMVFTYLQLTQNVKHLNVHTHNFALGEQQKTVRVKTDVSSPTSVSNSLVEKNFTNSPNYHEQDVKVVPLDDFCVNEKMVSVSYLKIDTEGYDLEVLKGATGLLSKAAIDFIESEVSMNKSNTFHVSLHSVSEFLSHYGYELFGIYEQIHDFKTGLPVLRRSNALFISPTVAAKNRKQAP